MFFKKNMKATQSTLLPLVVIVFLFQASAQETEFSYIDATGRGPSKWGELNFPKWEACGIGKLQSPINLKNPQLSSSLGNVQISYEPAAAALQSRGHDIQVIWTTNAGAIQIFGLDFMLQACHWHISSEHAIDGSRYDLELHLVHQNSAGETAVVAILYRIGQPDPFLTRLLPDIKTVTKEAKDLGIVNPTDIGFPTRNYYRYVGSLTTPPCTEGVIWTVFQEVRTASAEQVRALRDAVDDGFEMNARPLQAVNGRPIYLYGPE